LGKLIYFKYPATKSIGKDSKMAVATTKAQEIEEFLTELTGRNRVDCVSKNICTTCGGDASTFTDALSEKEFTISGMCQVCQDDIFGTGEE